MQSTQARPQRGAAVGGQIGVNGLLPLWRKNRQTSGAAVSKSTATRKRVVEGLYRVEKEGSSRRLVRRESASDANEKVANLMAKIGSGGVSSRREAAPKLMINRKLRSNSGPFAPSVRVKFMELRPSMCRWPIGDPKHIETFRFCGSACSSRAIYCKAHTAKAHAPIRPRTPRTTNFQLQHPVRVA